MTILDETLPKNAKTRARVVIGITLWGVVGAVWLIVAALTVGLPPFGRVAWAGDVDAKIQKAVEPIQAEVTELKNAVKAQTSVSNSLLASVTASQIRATYDRLWCGRPIPSDTERSRLNGDMDRFLVEYPKYADGREFPLASLRCKQ